MGRVASLTPQWLEEWEGEQGYKATNMAKLKEWLKAKREEAFAESCYEDKFDYVVNTYDLTLKKIEEIENAGNKV